MYTDWGLNKAFPQGLLDRLTVDGKIYSVPANIHRANVVWANKTVLDGRGHRPGPRRTLDALVRRPGQGQGHRRQDPAGHRQGLDPGELFETVLIADLGADKFNGLWDGTTDWTGADVTKAHRRLQEAADLHQHRPRRPRLDRRRRQLVMDGKAAYQRDG